MTAKTSAAQSCEGPAHVLPATHAERAPGWVHEAHRGLMNILFDEARPFPCFFAPEAERRQELAYTWLSPEEIDNPVRLHRALREFLDSPSFASNRSVLVVLCRLGAPRSAEHAFWSLLEHLLEHDTVAWPEGKCRDPDRSEWGFHYRGTELFINAHSAQHQQRRSRSAVVDLMLAIQRSSNFRDVIGLHEPSRVQLAIRKKLAAYDAVPLHEDLEVPAASPECRAWKQFWVPDHDRAEPRRCPLRRLSSDEER